MITYNVKLILDKDAKAKAIKMLESQRLAFNECSKVRFKQKKGEIRTLHKRFYKKFRKNHPEIPAQVVVRAINETIAAYKSIKSNRHKITEPAEKRRLSIRLDKRLYRFDFENCAISFTTLDKRVKAPLLLYPKVEGLLKEHRLCDPLIFERDGELFIALSFDVPHKPITNGRLLGIDLGINRTAATSNGIIFKNKGFNARKRQIRHLKSSLRAKGTKSARRHLRKIRNKEHDLNNDASHKLANEILALDAGIIVLEELRGMKSNRFSKNKQKGKFGRKQNNKLSQVPIARLRTILTYKAPFYGKKVKTVSPVFTSQIDHRTGRRSGKRVGARYYCKDGVVLDSDINAAINIAKRSHLKLPVSSCKGLDGQAVVNRPIVCKSPEKSDVLQAHVFKRG